MSTIGVHTLDLNFQGTREAIAAFLLRGPDGPVLVETGCGSTVDALQNALAEHGLRPEDIRDVLVTHIHLDHAGAAGWWARQGARIYVHHVGAPHLIDPTKLLASARRIYGDQMDTLWGDFLPSPVDQIVELHDGDVVEAGGLRITALDTPGHARHHMVYLLDGFAFTGDLAGIRLIHRPHLRMPTPPPEFHLEDWLASVAKVRERCPTRLYLTHFGAVDDIDVHWAKVEETLVYGTEFVRRELEKDGDRERILRAFGESEERRLLADGIQGADQDLYTAIGPPGMSVDGLMRYWQKKSR